MIDHQDATGTQHAHESAGVVELFTSGLCGLGSCSEASLSEWPNHLSALLHGDRMPEFNDTTQDMASGMAAFEAKEFAQAWRLLKPFADTGDAQAQHRVAIMCQNGLGMAPNPLMAYKWMRAAAEQGYAMAEHGLGFMYLYGECTEKNEKEAAKWFQHAAEHGLVGSAMTLGMMYEQGLGVEKNAVEAKKWYERAEVKA
jgi:TPR repeat protein